MFVRLRSFLHIKSYMKCTWMCTKNRASLTQSLTLVPQSLCQSRVDIFSVLSTFLFIHILLYTQRAKKVCACVFDLCHVLTYIWCVGSFWCAQLCVFKTSHQFVWQNIQLKGLLNRTDRRHCEMKCLQLGCEMCHFFFNAIIFNESLCQWNCMKYVLEDSLQIRCDCIWNDFELV